MDLRIAQREAIKAAHSAGAIMRNHLASAKRAISVTKHDIKLELDIRCQKIIENILHTAFPHVGVLGEEGILGNLNGEFRWVVDPIDGTVNFAYGIPHCCVSIALQERVDRSRRNGNSGVAGLRFSKSRSRAQSTSCYPDGYRTLLGVVYEPFLNELWTAVAGRPAQLNGKRIHVSRCRVLSKAIVSVGFAKSVENLEATLPAFNHLVRRVRKVRLMGAAALALTYVASGRFDVYIERGIRLWDIAAGGLILECAGGEFWREPIDNKHAYRTIATNGLLRRNLRLPSWTQTKGPRNTRRRSSGLKSSENA